MITIPDVLDLPKNREKNKTSTVNVIDNSVLI